MSRVISKIIELKVQKFPPCVDFIEKEIIKSGIEPLRWAITEINEDKLIICASGRIVNN